MAEHVITKLGHLGDGLSDGIVVPGALPGEVVTGEIADGMLADPKIITPSSDRIRPRCPHAKSCGGCVIQHGSDDLVASWKQAMVVDALSAHGIEAQVSGVLTSPPGSRRRATFAGRRTKKGALIGFHGRRSHTLIEVPNCLVITPKLQAVIPHLAAIAEPGGSRKGEIAFLVTETLNGPDVTATGGKTLDLPTRQTLIELGAAAGLARLSWDGELIAEWASPEIALGPARVALPPGAFLQATSHGQAVLTQAVQEIVGEVDRVADLFCGVGTFALPLSEKADVLAVESVPSQTDALTAAWRRCEGLHQLEAQTRDLFRRPLMPDELKRFDGVVIDPPRAGAAAQVAELARSDVAKIAAVSCNPSTFARDAATLIAGGYRMGPVAVVDQFRWSAHVEVVASFVR